MSNCECCGAPITYKNCKSEYSKDGKLIYLCLDCEEYNFCHVCKKMDSSGGLKLYKIGSENFCEDCYEENVKRCKTFCLDFIEYIVKEKGKNPKDFAVTNSGNMETEIKRSKYFKKALLFDRTNDYDYVRKISESGYTYFQSNELQLFFDIIDGHRFNKNYIAELTVYWDEFCGKAKLFDRPYGHLETVIIPNGCKNCAREIHIESDYGYRIKETGQISDSVAKLYRQVCDSNFICGCCATRIELINTFRKKMGWNNKWNQALDDFEKKGRLECGQANPNDFYNILKEYDIVMTQQIVDIWNSVFDKVNGIEIIKCYAIPDSTGARIEQQASRVADGFLRGLEKLFK